MTQELVFNNPLIPQRADPWVYRHTDGHYYFTASVPEYDRIELRRARTLQELATAQPVVVWRKHDSGPLSANIWAPEIHFIDGKWYIYFAAARTTDTNEGLFDHRMFVLENEAENPLEGQWTEKGQIRTHWESFALDATTFEHQGVRYLVWAQKDPQIVGNSNLYISKMENPWTLTGPQVMIATPEHPWEVIGFLVNEGPAVLKKNGQNLHRVFGQCDRSQLLHGALDGPGRCRPAESGLLGQIRPARLQNQRGKPAIWTGAQQLYRIPRRQNRPDGLPRTQLQRDCGRPPVRPQPPHPGEGAELEPRRHPGFWHSCP